MMDGCPSDNWLIPNLVLTGLLGLFVFLFVKLVLACRKQVQHVEKERARRASRNDQDLVSLQIELYGQKAMSRLQRTDSSTDSTSMNPNDFDAV